MNFSADPHIIVFFCHTVFKNSYEKSLSARLEARTQNHNIRTEMIPHCFLQKRTVYQIKYNTAQ